MSQSGFSDRLKRAAKKTLPASMLGYLRRRRADHAERQVEGLSVEDTFDAIYARSY